MAARFHWPKQLHWMRYLLIWPLIGAYRRKTRTRLSWRLAGSHFATVLVSVAVICVVTILIAIVASKLATPGFDEAAAEADQVAAIVEDVNRTQSFDQAQTISLLKAIAAGAVVQNEHSDVNIHANAGRIFEDVRSVSIVSSTGIIIASSDPALTGQAIPATDPTAWSVVSEALTHPDHSDPGKLSTRRQDGTAVVGASPLRGANGEVIGAVLVDKSRSAIPRGWDLFHLLLVFIAQFGVFLLVLVGLPAIPVGIIIGIRRGRAISRPIRDLASVATHFAAGDLTARVAPIRGQDEVAGLQREFNKMADRLQSSVTDEAEQRAIAERALTANRDLIANVSHELRTPVALIRAHLEALEAEPESTEAYLRITLRETERLERLVDELFELSRLEANRMELDLAPFDAGAVVRSAVEAVAEPARREAGLTVMASVEPGDLTCTGDRLRFEQVLLNLVRNAIRYTPEGGIIMVTAGPGARGHVRIAVQDTGIGIPAADLPHVFDRFFRADRSHSRTGGGAGLGLAIAREYVAAMGGTIAVASVEDEGTTFTIELAAAAQLSAASPVSDGAASPA